jgi:hypothetical protein
MYGIAVDPMLTVWPFIAKMVSHSAKNNPRSRFRLHSTFYTRKHRFDLSSSRALRDITLERGEIFFGSRGEVNVVAKMKEVNAVIEVKVTGVIYPASH